MPPRDADTTWRDSRDRVLDGSDRRVREYRYEIEPLWQGVPSPADTLPLLVVPGR